MAKIKPKICVIFAIIEILAIISIIYGTVHTDDHEVPVWYYLNLCETSLKSENDHVRTFVGVSLEANEVCKVGMGPDDGSVLSVLVPKRFFKLSKLYYPVVLRHDECM